MKVAVCLYGQSRTWRTAKDNIKKFFGDVDYFIHTWDINTYNNYKEPDKYKLATYKISKLDEIDLINSFEPKSYEIEHFDDNKNLSWYPMQYSFMKSVWMKRKCELSNDFIYDIVINARFDVNYKDDKFIIQDIIPFFAYVYNNNFSKFTHEFNYNNCADVIFYSDSPTMDIISNMARWFKDIYYKNLVNRTNSCDPEYYYGPGTLLYKYLVNHGIHPKGSNNLDYYIVRQEAEDLKLNSIVDCEQIKKISDDYFKDIKSNRIY